MLQHVASRADHRLRKLARRFIVHESEHSAIRISHRGDGTKQGSEIAAAAADRPSGAIRQRAINAIRRGFERSEEAVRYCPIIASGGVSGRPAQRPRSRPKRLTSSEPGPVIHGIASTPLTSAGTFSPPSRSDRFFAEDVEASLGIEPRVAVFRSRREETIGMRADRKVTDIRAAHGSGSLRADPHLEAQRLS